MKLFIKLFLFMCLVPLSAMGQDVIRQAMVGPYGEDVRVIIAFIEPSEDKFKTQSMIIDIKPDKKKEQADSFEVDLTSTIRTISTGEKKQKIFLLRLEKKGKIQLKCEGNWKNKDTEPVIDNIVETIKAVIKNIPLDSKERTEVTLPSEVEQKVSSVLDSLDIEEIPCLRNKN